MRIELLLDHRLRPRLLARRLMLRLKLGLAGLADSDDRNILDSLNDPKIALRHADSLTVRVGRTLLSAAFDFEVGFEM